MNSAPHEPRRLGYYAASKWFQAAVLFVVLGIFALALLSALSDVKQQAEREMVELTLRNMRTGMQLAMGEALMQQREGEIAAWVGSNPISWLGASPVGYQGECAPADGSGLKDGEWCFAGDRQALVYRPHGRERVRDVTGGGDSCRYLQWRVTSTAEQNAQQGFAGLRIENVGGCRWRADEK